MEFPKLHMGHYYLPVIYHATRSPSAQTSFSVPYCLVDFGATKCLIPKIVNENTLKLPILDRNKDIDTGKGLRDFDVVVIPRMGIARLDLKGDQLIFLMSDLDEYDVQAWLGGNKQEFVLGMNFLEKFDISFKRVGKVIISR